MTEGFIQKGSKTYWQTLSAIFLGTLATYGDMYSTQPLIPVFARDFQLSPAEASLSMSAVSAGLAVAMVLIVGVACMLERRRTMAASILIGAALTLVVAWSDHFGLIVLCRALQGMILAGFPAVAMAYIMEEFDRSIIGLVMGIYISGSSLGGMFSRIFVGVLTDYFNWHWALTGMGCLGLVTGIWFWIALRPSRHFLSHPPVKADFLAGIRMNLNLPVFLLYFVAFALLGSFIAVYNYIAYPLMAPPYGWSHTEVSLLFLLYLTGTVSSTIAGRLVDYFGNGRVLTMTLTAMIAGSLVTLSTPLLLKIGGLALFTLSFFGSHAAASSWVGKRYQGDKAQASALYLLFYYCGASVVGTAGGVFLEWQGWPGVVLCVSLLLVTALVAVGYVIGRQGERVSA